MLTYYQSERLELRILKPDSSSAVLDFMNETVIR